MPPHTHVPVALQVFAVIPQLAHVPPPDPHVEIDSPSHVVPAQQPEQEAESQAQVAVEPVPVQWSPLLHGGPEPHRHAPPVQLFDVAPSHATQAEPPVPQVDVEGMRQLLELSQHPAGHEATLHWQTPLRHS
jgi:hypothetical protein